MSRNAGMLAVVLGISALAVPGKAYAQETEYRYVATPSMTYMGLWDVAAGILADAHPVGEGAGRVAPFGYLEVNTSGTSLTVNIDDLGTRDGFDVPVMISTGGRSLFRGCMPVRSKTTIAGVSADQPTLIVIGSAYLRTSVLGCSGIATAGAVTVASLD